MDPNLKSHIGKLCRTCLTVSDNLQPLDGKMLQILSQIMNKSIAICNHLAHNICLECEKLLYQSHNFIQRCLANEETLKNWFGCTELEDHKNVQNGPEIGQENKSNLILNPYQCSICWEKYPNVTELHEHCSFKHNIKNCNESKENKVTIEINGVENILSSNSFKDEPSENDNMDFFDSIDNRCDPEDVKVDLYDCDKCNASFTKRNKFKLHIKSHLKDDVKKTRAKCKKKSPKPAVYQCNKCDLVLKSERSYKIHIATKHIIKDCTVKREFDENMFDGNTNKEDGVSQDLNQTQMHQCSMCMRKFIKKESLILHIKRHEEKANETYSCKICKRDFKHQAHLDNHVQSVHIHAKASMQEVATGSNTKKHTCKFCGKSFQMLSTLRDHMRVHTGEKPFLCSTCGRGFSQKTNLKEHMRRHQGLKPYKCESCDQKFVSKGELVAHTRKHTGAHPFVCDTCNTGFTTSSSLVKHRRVHTGEKPFVCEFCPMRFAASSTLKNHRRTHTGEKPYHCAHCDKAFVQRNDLVSHTRCHTGERPYICSICGQAFRQGSALKTHQKMHSQKETSALMHVQRRDNLGGMGLQNLTLISNIICDNSSVLT